MYINYKKKINKNNLKYIRRKNKDYEYKSTDSFSFIKEIEDKIH